MTRVVFQNVSLGFDQTPFYAFHALWFKTMEKGLDQICETLHCVLFFEFLQTSKWI